MNKKKKKTETILLLSTPAYSLQQSYYSNEVTIVE